MRGSVALTAATQVREPLDHLLRFLPKKKTSVLARVTREEIEAAYGPADSVQQRGAGETTEWVAIHAPKTASPGTFLIRNIPEWSPPPGDVTSHVPGRTEYEYLHGSGPTHPGDLEALKKSFLSSALANLLRVKAREEYRGATLSLAVWLARAFSCDFTIHVEKIRRLGGTRPLFHVHWEGGADREAVLTQSLKALEGSLHGDMYSVEVRQEDRGSTGGRDV